MDAKELKAAQDNLKKKTQAKKAQNSKVADLLTAGKRIGSKPIKHEIGGFEFETISVLSRENRKKFSDAVSRMNNSESGVDDVLNACAELMAELCIDEELAKLHLPFPVAYIFFESSLFFSRTITFFPHCAATAAAVIPAGPEPITATS